MNTAKRAKFKYLGEYFGEISNDARKVVREAHEARKSPSVTFSEFVKRMDWPKPTKRYPDAIDVEFEVVDA